MHGVAEGVNALFPGDDPLHVENRFAQDPVPPRRSGVQLEEVIDEDGPLVETFVEVNPRGGTTFGRGEHEFQKRRAEQEQAVPPIPPCAPFANYEDYEYGSWMFRAVSSLTEIDNGLKLKIVCSFPAL